MKTIILAMTMLMLAVSTVTALTMSNVTLSGTPGHTVQGILTITNNNTSVNVSISTGYAAGIPVSAIHYNPQTFSVGPNGQRAVTVTVDIPDNAQIQQYPVVMRATFTGQESGVASSALFVNVIANHAPVLSVPDQSATVGQAFTYQLAAVDEDSDSITYSLVSVQPTTNLQVSQSGLLTWTPATVGVYTVNVAADDGHGAIIYDTFTITVTSASGSSGLDIGSINIGGSNTERERVVTGQFVVTNNGATQATGLVLSSDLGSAYHFNMTASSLTIPAFGTVTVSYQLFVPDNQNAGSNNIGLVSASAIAGGQTISASEPVVLAVENNLVISDMTVTIDGDDDGSVDDGDNFDQVRGGSDIEFVIEVENTFGDSIEISDIEIEVEGEDDFDFDESEDVSDLDDGDNDEVTFTYTVDSDIDDGTYDVEIRLTGVDENDARHGETWTLSFEVDKDRDDIRITDVTLNPGQVRQGATSVRLTVDLENVGSRDQDSVFLRVVSSELDYENTIRNLQLDEGDDLTQTMTVTLPRNLDEGSVTFDVSVYTSSDEDDQTDNEVATLEIIGDDDNELPPVDDDDDDDNGGTIVVQPPIVSPPGSSGTVVGTATGSRPGVFTSSNGTYMALLVGAFVLLAVLIILATAALVRRK